MCKKLSVILIVGFFLSGTLSGQSLKEALQRTDNEQYELATDIYRALVAKEPQKADNYFYYGDNYFKAENPDSAKIIFEKGLSIDPNNALCTVGSGKLLLDQISVEEAKAALEHEKQLLNKAQQSYDRDSVKSDEKRTSVEELKKMAEAARSKADHAQAAVTMANSDFQKALDATQMKDVNVLMEVAEALTQAKNKDLPRALDLLNKAITIDPKNVQVLIHIGNVYIEQRNGNLSAEYFNKALDLDPKNLHAILQKGILYFRSTNYEAAMAEFQKALSIDPAFAPAHRQAGETYWRQNKVDQALEEYNKYLEINKGSSSARIRYIAFLYLIRHYKEDIDEIGKLPKFDSSSVMLDRIASYSYYEAGDSLNALKLLRKVFQLVPEDKILSSDYAYYGRTLAKLGQDSLGLTEVRKALDIDSTNADLMNEMANMLFKLKKYNEAAIWFQKKIDLKKGVTYKDYWLLGQSYFFNRDFVNADSAFTKLVEYIPTWPSGYLWRAKALYFIDGDTACKEGLAKPDYEKFIQLATADTVNMNAHRYDASLVEAYGYLSLYYANRNDKPNVLDAMRKKLLYTSDPAEKASLRKAIDQIEHPPVQKQPKPKAK